MKFTRTQHLQAAKHSIQMAAGTGSESKEKKYKMLARVFRALAKKAKDQPEHDQEDALPGSIKSDH